MKIYLLENLDYNTTYTVIASLNKEDTERLAYQANTLINHIGSDSVYYVTEYEIEDLKNKVYKIGYKMNIYLDSENNEYKVEMCYTTDCLDESDIYLVDRDTTTDFIQGDHYFSVISYVSHKHALKIFKDKLNGFLSLNANNNIIWTEVKNGKL